MAKVDSFPDRGMYYEQARGRARRFAKQGDFKVVNSLINQVRHGEGERAARELGKEISKDFNKGQ